MADRSEIKQVNVRLPVELVEQVEAIQQVEAMSDPSRSLASVFREALEAFVEERRKDPKFQAARKQALEAQRKRLDLVK